eukprot:8240194-Karenia_brevis.AAC.1
MKFQPAFLSKFFFIFCHVDVARQNFVICNHPYQTSVVIFSTIQSPELRCMEGWKPEWMHE